MNIRLNLFKIRSFLFVYKFRELQFVVSMGKYASLTDFSLLSKAFSFFNFSSKSSNGIRKHERRTYVFHFELLFFYKTQHGYVLVVRFIGDDKLKTYTYCISFLNTNILFPWMWNIKHFYWTLKLQYPFYWHAMRFYYFLRRINLGWQRPGCI